MGEDLYVGSCAGMLYDFDAATGEVKWQFDVAPDGAVQFHGIPLVVDSVIVVGTDEGMMATGALYALNRHTGELFWKSTGHTGLGSDVAYDGDRTVFVVTREDSVLAFDLFEGTTRWTFVTGWDINAEATYELPSRRPPYVSLPQVLNHSLLVRGRNNVLYSLACSTGEVQWQRQLGPSVSTQPLVVDDQVLFGTDRYHMVRYSAITGEFVREDSVPFVPQETMAASDSLVIYLGGRADGRPRRVAALDLRSGETRWTYSLSDPDPMAYWYVPRVHIWRDQAIVGSTGGIVVALDLRKGMKGWHYALEGPIRGIGHGGDLLFVGTFHGMLHALRVTE